MNSRIRVWLFAFLMFGAPALAAAQDDMDKATLRSTKEDATARAKGSQKKPNPDSAARAMKERGSNARSKSDATSRAKRTRR